MCFRYLSYLGYAAANEKKISNCLLELLVMLVVIVLAGIQ